MERISWTVHVRNEDILYRIKAKRNIIHKIKRRKVNWLDHILCMNCLLRSVTKVRWKDKEDDVSSYWLTLRNKKILEAE
jgi:hypothetical protein